jgi:Ser/Thr protein kinase RdoA (MazF antagonist)
MMSNDLEAPPQDSASRYTPVAAEALRQYPLGPTRLHFIAHNAGAVFRVEALDQARSYMLKLHIRVGEGKNASAATLELGMQWLAGISRDTDITVQTPMATLAGPFVGTVLFEGHFIHCTLQQWLEGRFPNGPFSEENMHQIGVMMAKLHRYSRLSTLPLNSTTQHGPEALNQHVLLLRRALDDQIFPESSYAIVKAAQQKIEAIMLRLGKTQEGWGPVHGDLHYDNILLGEGELEGNVSPIDFSELRVAHYLYDMGVTLYHTLHEGATKRQAFLQGYQQVEPLYRQHLQYLEAFVTYAAIDSIAWNATIPEQVEHALFRKNLDQLVFDFCHHINQGISFFDSAS